MGFKLPKKISGPGALIGSMINGPAGAVIGGLFGNKIGKAVGLSKTDAEVAAEKQERAEVENIRALGQRRNDVTQIRSGLNNNLAGQKQQIEQNMPQRNAELMGRESDLSKQALAHQMKATDRSAQSRGLLFSGLDQKAHADEASQNAATLGQRQQAIYAQSQDLLQSLNDSSFNDSLTRHTQDIEMQKATLGEDSRSYDMALQQRMAGNQAMGNLVGGAAGIGGIAMAQPNANAVKKQEGIDAANNYFK